MKELMTGPLGLLLAAAVLWWGITFNSRLDERYHCTACTFWGVTGGVVGFFCWLMFFGNKFTFSSLVVAVIALIITLALFFNNRAKSGSTLQGLFMTVWQLFVGFVVVGILVALDSRDKKD